MRHVCVVGGGPAGMVMGLLLARQGLRVTVLEKHADFLRDFRGDTVHPSTLTVLDELGLLKGFLALPHTRMDRVQVRTGGLDVTMGDFSRLPGPAPFVAFVPQWDLLDFLARAARGLPGFELAMEAEVTDLVRDGAGRVTGVEAIQGGTTRRVEADLVIGADGRHSAVRRLLGLEPVETGPRMDVLWFRLPRRTGESMPLFHAGAGALICLDRGAYWQIAHAVAPGRASRLRAEGIEALRRRVARMEPALADRVSALTWEDIHLLESRIDRLPRWDSDGALCLGDAAHAMSPAGGVGVNLAVQDAVAAARILGPRLRAGAELDLDAVRRRREWPVRVTQAFQAQLGRRIVAADQEGTPTLLPQVLGAVGRVSGLAHVMGRFIGLGVRPEHVG